MPLTPTNYLNSVIYKIEHESKPELLYIGSTTNFIKRKAKHKFYCNDKNKKCNTKLYQMMRDNGGFNEFKIMVIKEYPCNNKIELIIEEEKHRKEYNANLNTLKAYRTDEEEKEYFKEYKANNKDLIKTQNKEYITNNKDKIKEYKKEYYETNKEKIKEQFKEKINCLCGSIICKNEKTRHEKSKKHQLFLNSLLLK